MDSSSIMNFSSNEPSHDHSYTGASLDSINILGLNCSENQLEPMAQDIQTLTLDWQMLQQHPLLFRETARLLQTRAHTHQKLHQLAAEFYQLSQNINHQSPSQQIRADKLTQLHESSQNLRKLQLQFDRINYQNDQQAEKTQSLRKINRQMLAQFKQLQQFIYQMANDPQNNPFVTVQDATYIKCLSLVSEINSQLGRSHAQIQVPSQDILETIKVNNSAIIEERTQWIKILQELDTEVNNLIEQEQLLFQVVKDSIIEAKRQRNNNEEMDDENSEIELEIDLVPSLLQNAIEATDTTVKDCERINVTLQEYQHKIRQLSKNHTSLETDLKSAQSILSQKTSKYAYLQKQNKQLSAEQKKLQSLNDRSIKDIRDSVNYKELVFKTYEQKEMPKSQKQKDQMVIDISSEMAKPVRRIVVGKKTLEIQKWFPFINNYRQLVNWAIVLWVLIVLAVFLGKTLGDSEVLPSSPQIIEFELHSKPTFQTIQTQPKIDLGVENQTSNIIETPTAQETNTIDSDKEWKVLTEKRTHMEQVNTKTANDENQDWINIASKEFQ